MKFQEEKSRSGAAWFNGIVPQLLMRDRALILYYRVTARAGAATEFLGRRVALEPTPQEIYAKVDAHGD